MFANINFLRILNLIDKQKSTSSLTEKGLSYSQIASLLNEVLEKEWVLLEDERIRLTAEGKKQFALLKQSTYGKEWIVPDNKSKVEPISPDFIYVPKRVIME